VTEQAIKMKRMSGGDPREIAAQMFRYGVTGLALALLYAGIYWAGASLLAVPAQSANMAGFAASLLTGYLLHSRWSFRGHGRRTAWSWGRYFTVNSVGYLLNCFWVWLIVDLTDHRVELAIAPIVLVTPAFTFLLNRRWTFA
jgi:putative flippase GtrA